MPFNQEWGVGRDPQVRNAISKVSIEVTSDGLATNDPPHVSSTTIPAGVKVFAMGIQIQPTSSGASIDSARFRVFVDGYPVADYALPNSDSWASNISDMIPTDIPVWNTGTLRVEYGPVAPDITGYNIGFSVTAYLVTM